MKPHTDYESLTKKQLLTQIITHELTKLHIKSDYSLSNTDNPLESTHIGCKYAYWGDYCGDTCTRSNQIDLYSQFKDHGAIEEHGGYYSIFTLIPLHTLKKWKKDTLIHYLETLDSLTDYPLINDEDLSNLENDILLESWDNYIQSDILTGISKLIEIESKSSYSLMDQQRLYDLSQDLNENYLFVIDTPTFEKYNYHHSENLLDLYSLYSHFYQNDTSDYPIYETATSAYVDTEKISKWMHIHIIQYIYKSPDQTNIRDYCA